MFQWEQGMPGLGLGRKEQAISSPNLRSLTFFNSTGNVAASCPAAFGQHWSDNTSSFMTEADFFSLFDLNDASYNIKFSPDYLDLNNNSDDLRVQMTVSVGCSIQHRQKYFRDSLKKLCRTYGNNNVVIMLDDIIQWRTLAIGVEDPTQRTQEHLMKKAQENARAWLLENLPYIFDEQILQCVEKENNNMVWKNSVPQPIQRMFSQYLQQKQKGPEAVAKWLELNLDKIMHLQETVDYPGKIEIVRWKNFDAIKVQQAVQEMNDLYRNDSDFKQAVDETALDFLLRIKGYDFSLEPPVSTTLEPGVFHLYLKNGVLQYDVKSPFSVDLREQPLNIPSLEEEIMELISTGGTVKNDLKKKILNVISERVSQVGNEKCPHVRNKLGRLNGNFEPYCTNEEILSMSVNYLLEECGIMAKIWTTHPKLKANIEAYPKKRTKAMKAVEERYIKKIYHLSSHLSEGNVSPSSEQKSKCQIAVYVKEGKLYYETKLSKSKNVSEAQREITKKDCVDVLKMSKNKIKDLFHQVKSSNPEDLIDNLAPYQSDFVRILKGRNHILFLLEAMEMKFEKTQKDELALCSTSTSQRSVKR